MSIYINELSVEFIRGIKSLKPRSKISKAFVAGFEHPRKGQLSYKLTANSIAEKEISEVKAIIENIKSELKTVTVKLNDALRFIRSNK